MITFIGRYWRVICVAAVVGIALFTLQRCTERAEKRGYDRAQAEGKAAIEKLDAETAKREAKDREISRQHDIAHQEHRRELQDQIDRLTAARSVDLGRLQGCADRRRAAPAGATASSAKPDGAPSRAEHAVPPGGDPAGELGLQLVRYAGECEAYRLRLKDFQSWVSATSTGGG